VKLKDSLFSLSAGIVGGVAATGMLIAMANVFAALWFNAFLGWSGVGSAVGVLGLSAVGVGAVVVGADIIAEKCNMKLKILPALVGVITSLGIGISILTPEELSTNQNLSSAPEEEVVEMLSQASDNAASPLYISFADVADYSEALIELPDNEFIIAFPAP